MIFIYFLRMTISQIKLRRLHILIRSRLSIQRFFRQVFDKKCDFLIFFTHDHQSLLSFQGQTMGFKLIYMIYWSNRSCIDNYEVIILCPSTVTGFEPMISRTQVLP